MFVSLPRFSVLAFIGLVAYFAAWPWIAQALSGGAPTPSGLYDLYLRKAPYPLMFCAAALALWLDIWKLATTWPRRLISIAGLMALCVVMPGPTLEITFFVMIRVACYGFGACI